MVHRLNNPALFGAVSGKALFIPENGWRAESFRRYGLGMIRTMHRVAVITQRQQAAEVTRLVTKAFRKQVTMAVRRFADKIKVTVNIIERGEASVAVPMGKAAEDIFVAAHEDLFLDVLNQVLEETGSEVTARIVPGVQSTLAQGYSKTSILLAQQPDPRHNVGLQRRAQGLASRITRVGDTTRNRFKTLLDKAVKEQWTVVETANRIQQDIPRIQSARALTIARTELNNAWTQGAVQSFKESKTLTMVSVIGCESREQDRWDTPAYQPYLYRGESTCNIQDVPVADADKLEFHINHTGTMVPSGFIE